MSQKKATTVVLFALIVVAVMFYFTAPTGRGNNPIGPDFYPSSLSIILIILCLISLFQTYKKKDEKLQLYGFRRVIASIFITSLFFLSWHYIGYFYLNALLFVFVLLTYFRWELGRTKVFILNAIYSVAFIVMVYILFNLVMNIRL